MQFFKHGDRSRNGVILGLTAYTLWGGLPLYFVFLSRTDAVEIVAHRIIWGFVFCAVLLVVAGQWSSFVQVLRNRRQLAGFAVTGLLITANWGTYVWAVNHGFTLDASLGYFVNPLVSTLLGVLLLGERMRPMQWLAFAVGVVAMVVLLVAYGHFPWVAVVLALSFGFYGLVKKKLVAVPVIHGLATETLLVVPLAMGYLVWAGVHGTATDWLHSGLYPLFLILLGPITAVPLLLFAASVARLNLVTVGIIQYLGPILQFLVGWRLLGEDMPVARWIGFIVIWFSVIIFLYDAFLAARKRRAGLSS